MASKSDVVILCWDRVTPSDRRAQAIAAFLGAESTTVVVTPDALGDGLSLKHLVPRCATLIVDVETLSSAAEALRSGLSGVAGVISDLAEQVFVYGFQPTERHGAVLRTLSSGLLRGVEPHSGTGGFQVADGDREWTGPFSGVRVDSGDPTRDRRFIASDGAQQHAVVRAGEQPFFVRMRLGGAQVSLLASAELADLEEPARRETSALSWFSRLVPLMMFLRGTLGDRVWRNDSPRACFTIDDPMLGKGRYGFLEYDRLIDSMRRLGFSTSIAFIPWNYRRSSREVAKLFSSTNGGLTLCVHGCDHTRGEFATKDVDVLRTKAHVALDRMRIHRQLSTVPFDDVMVFPQGLFSAEALGALSAADYLAAVNSDLFPSTEPENLVLRDLLEVAVTRFADFPLFGRRYPRTVAEFAFDLFLGKPALAVEHHGYFRDGYAALETFVEQVNSLDERLEWSGLGRICSRACLTRTGADGETQVRFYGNRFSLTNPGTSARRYLLVRQHSADGSLPAISIDGRTRPARMDDGRLKVGVSLTGGQTAEVRVSSTQAPRIGPRRRQTKLQDARVSIRRHLSEFRDNHVDTSRVLSALVATARN